MGIQHRGGTSIKRLGGTDYWTESDGNMRRKSKVTTKLQWKLGAATTAVTGSVTILYEVVRREFTINEKRKKKEKRNRKDKVNSTGTNV